jgi:hypothetical protein
MSLSGYWHKDEVAHSFGLLHMHKFGPPAVNRQQQQPFGEHAPAQPFRHVAEFPQASGPCPSSCANAGAITPITVAAVRQKIARISNTPFFLVFMC